MAPDERRDSSTDHVDPEDASPLTRVLVVDDDSAVGRCIGRVLRGFKVTFAQSAAGALGRIGAGARFAAIVCDVNMPGMTGIQFHAAVARIDPALARSIVYITGASGAPEFSEFLDRTRSRWLPKPFDPAELRRVVGEVATSAA
jgi:two-component system NtrC family sensor kinase